MLRDRETWMTALCFWLVGGMLIGFFCSRWLKGFPPMVAVIAVVAAAPVSLALAIYQRRSEARSARERASLRADGRFEEAAEWQADGFYNAWTSYRMARAGVAALLTMIGIVLLMPLLVFGGACVLACELWWAYMTNRDHKADIERRRTSKARITSAQDALEDSGWNRPTR